MKEFRKNEQGLFICEECGLAFKKIQSLSKHVSLYHKNKKDYYDKWIKENNDDKCQICKKKTKFIGFYGYKNCCSVKCTNKYAHKLSKLGMNKKYGCDYPLQSLEVQNNMKNTIHEKYNCDWFVVSSKYKSSMLKKFGVENTLQNSELFNKGFKKRIESGLKLKQFKNTDIWYQGSFEFDFLEKFYNIIDIKRAPSLKYNFKNKSKIYHPDFYIQSLNLIVECKNHYLAKRDKDKIEAKEKATIANGFNYIMIVDKDYKEFKSLFIS